VPILQVIAHTVCADHKSCNETVCDLFSDSLWPCSNVNARVNAMSRFLGNVLRLTSQFATSQRLLGYSLSHDLQDLGQPLGILPLVDSSS